MNYPLISEYIESIRAAEDNFAELNYLRPVLDEAGNPIMTSGNFAVVFKMKDERTGKLHAVKCFLKEQEGRAEAYRMIAEELEYVSSTFLTPIKYLDKELFVDTNASDETEFPVLLMDWVEGQTLGCFLQEKTAHYFDNPYIRDNELTDYDEYDYDEYLVQIVTYQFSILAKWLITQPFAHGDLKPDNIMVRKDGTLMLVDYDGMFVPSMKGQKARELGSPDFRHPLRTEETFDEHIDDFALTSILLSLRIIVNYPWTLKKYGSLDRLLFSEKDYCDIASCPIIKLLFPSEESELNKIYAVFLLAIHNQNLMGLSPDYLTIHKPTKSIIYSDGGIYYDNYNRVSGYDWEIDEPTFIINNGIKYIDDRAFIYSDAVSLNLPSSLIEIGGWAFSGCTSLQSISLPFSLQKIGVSAFKDCSSLKNITIPEFIKFLDIGTFAGCTSLERVTFLTSSLIAIGSSDASYIESYLEDNPTDFDAIGVFCRCSSLKRIILPDSVKELGCEVFRNCISLESIKLPSSLETIGANAFSGCSSLKEIYIQNVVDDIDDYVFEDCPNLKSIYIPSGSKNKYEALLPYNKNKLIELI